MRKTLRTATLLISFLLLAAPLMAWGDCDHKAPREASIDTAGASVIEIHAEAGSLEITGETGINSVDARGQACAKREAALDEIRIETDRRGDRVVVRAEIPNGKIFDGASLNLKITVPADVPLEIDDGSGSIDVRGTAGLRIDDGSGSIELRDINGDVRLSDGSGSISVDGVRGSVEAEDGSGSMTFVDIEGDVMIRDDGSGSISVRDVGGDFTVRDDGSGGISHDKVAGNVRIPKDS